MWLDLHMVGGLPTDMHRGWMREKVKYRVNCVYPYRRECKMQEKQSKASNCTWGPTAMVEDLVDG